MKTLAERFWPRVEVRGPDECWPWTGATKDGGYGHIDGRPAQGAHRVSWVLHIGPIPDGMHVLHNCDNPPCVNPAHLRLGTNADNIKDKLDRGRASMVGLTSKLTWEQAREIRRRARLGNHGVLAQEFGVSRSLVSLIAEGKRWVEQEVMAL